MKPGNGGRQMTAVGDQPGPGSDTQVRPPPAARPVLTAGRLRIRLGQRGDAARLRAILAEPSVARWWSEPDGETAIEADLAGDGSGALLVIEIGGQVAGGIQYHEEDDPMYRHAGIDIYLSGSFQGQGAGRQAIALLAGWLLRSRGHHRITIDPAAANEQAIRCYAAVGFRPVGVMRQYERGPDGTFHDGLLMDLLRSELAGA
jgi:aminoglycoside 6'-N-acetyltransferase